MSEITKGDHAEKAQETDPAGVKHGVPAGAAQGDAPGGYGGDDRLKTETALHPEAGKDQAENI